MRGQGGARGPGLAAARRVSDCSPERNPTGVPAAARRGPAGGAVLADQAEDNPESTGREGVARRERLWDTVVEAQRGLLPAAAPDLLWEPERIEERITAYEELVPAALERACVSLRVLGAAPLEWHVGLPFDRFLERYLRDSYSGELVAMAIDRVSPTPLGLAGAARWVIHARGAELLPPHDAVRLVPPLATWALAHPVARNRTETLELLGDIRAPFVVPLLHAVLAGAVETRAATAQEQELMNLFGEPETFFVVDDHLLRGTGDRAYAALLLARRGERGIRPRVREMMETAGQADFHALALALEELEKGGA